MFNNSDKKQAVLVKLALSDGRTVQGKLILPASSGLSRTLNGEAGFLEFEADCGTKSIIAKSAIVEVVLAEMPGAVVDEAA